MLGTTFQKATATTHHPAIICHTPVPARKCPLPPWTSWNKRTRRDFHGRKRHGVKIISSKKKKRWRIAVTTSYHPCIPSLKLTARPKNWWLEDDSFPFGIRLIFRGELLVLGRVLYLYLHLLYVYDKSREIYHTSGQIIIFHLDFPEIRGFPLLNHHLGWGRVRSL